MSWTVLPIVASLGLVGSVSQPQRFTYAEPHMGTQFRITFYAPNQETADQAARAAFKRVAQLNRIMSDYDPASELMRLCKKNNDDPGTPVPVSEELFFVLSKAREVSELSDGTFDVTVKPFVHLWRMARRTEKLPTEKELAEAKAVVGYKLVKLDRKNRTVTLGKPGMELDLGGIAKGYAADEVLKVLRGHGITSALVAAGGDIASMGKPPGKDAWVVEIAPLSRDTPKRYVALSGQAVSTSGDLEQFVVIDGVRYSHIVDPRTGIGLTERKMVTVIAPDGITADSMTKVASLLPPKRAQKLIDAIDGAATQIVRRTKDGQEETIRSARFADYRVDP